MRRRRLLILTQHFPPEQGAPQARLSELGEALVRRGWTVEALTALPNYPTGEIFPGYDPSVVAVEQVGSIRTVRVPLRPANRGFARRLVAYLSFVRSAMHHGPKHCARPDLIWVESPPLFIGWAARSLAKRWGCPYVFNVSDLWPESAVRMGVVRDGFLARAAERLELSFYRSAAGVTAQSAESLDSIRKRAPGVRTALVSNGVDPDRFGPDRGNDAARDLLGSERPTFVYAGLLGLAQGLDQLLDLAADLPDDVPGALVLVGDGPERERLVRRVSEEQIERVKILPAQPRERIPALLGAADAAIVSLGMRLPGAVPSKIYEAMATALPLLLIAEGEAAEKVRQAGCGLVVQPGRPEELRQAFVRLARDPDIRRQMGQAGRHAAETLYARSAIADELHSFLVSVLENGAGAEAWGREEQRILAENQRRERTVDPDLYTERQPAGRVLRRGQARAVRAALARNDLLPLSETRILDVGCGKGTWLELLISLGASETRVAGVDLDESRLSEARRRLPQADLRHGSGADLPWEDGSFDVVTQATALTSVLDPSLRRAVAIEMARVLARDGALLWYDFLYDNPRNAAVRGIGRREIARLFPQFELDIQRVTLAPPLARPISRISETLASGLERLRVLNSHYLAIARRTP